MPSNSLRRVPASKVVPPFDLLSALALKAEALLGYSRLRLRLEIPPTSLMRALEDLDLEPFRTDDVARYKKSKARDVTEQAWAEFHERAHVDPHGAGMIIGSFVSARWRTVPLSRYEGEIPEYVLSRAIEIKEKIPQAEFYVDYLSVEKRYDPFLIVACGRERFYVDVWDEPDFENFC
ncbi:MAG: hypothetical protein ACE14M_11285 [Terriglobales bacterium]